MDEQREHAAEPRNVPGTDGRWYYHLIARGPLAACIAVREHDGDGLLSWPMLGGLLDPADIDRETLRRIQENEHARQQPTYRRRYARECDR